MRAIPSGGENITEKIPQSYDASQLISLRQGMLFSSMKDASQLAEVDALSDAFQSVGD